MGTSSFPHDEEGEDDERSRQRTDDERRGPGAVRSLDDRPEQQSDAHDRQDRTQWIGPPGLGALRIWDDKSGGYEADQDDGDVDEEDRAPPKVHQEKAPQHRPDGHPQPSRCGPDPDGAGSLSICREHIGQDRQRGGHQRRRAHPHDRPRPDEPLRSARPRRQGRPAPKDDEATHEHPLAPYPITERSEAQQQTSKEDRKGIDDPLQLGRGRVQTADDRRQGDIENRVVEADQQQGDAQNGQGHPAPGAGHRNARGRHPHPPSDHPSRPVPTTSNAPHSAPATERSRDYSTSVNIPLVGVALTPREPALRARRSGGRVANTPWPRSDLAANPVRPRLAGYSAPLGLQLRRRHVRGHPVGRYPPEPPLSTMHHPAPNDRIGEANAGPTVASGASAAPAHRQECRSRATPWRERSWEGLRSSRGPQADLSRPRRTGASPHSRAM